MHTNTYIIVFTIRMVKHFDNLYHKSPTILEIVGLFYAKKLH